MARHRPAFAWALSFLSAAAFVVGASARMQDPQNPPPPSQEPADPAAAGRGGRGAAAPAPRPYAQVITSAAKTDEGIFKVHRIGETIFYEIPQAQLGKDFLWVTQIKRTTIGAGYGGQAVAFEHSSAAEQIGQGIADPRLPKPHNVNA